MALSVSDIRENTKVNKWFIFILKENLPNLPSANICSLIYSARQGDVIGGKLRDG